MLTHLENGWQVDQVPQELIVVRKLVQVLGAFIQAGHDETGCELKKPWKVIKSAHNEIVYTTFFLNVIKTWGCQCHYNSRFILDIQIFQKGSS
jgi:hypothetical protein